MPRLKAFGKLLEGRGDNDFQNSDRERAIELLFSPDSDKQDLLLEKSSDRNGWRVIRSAFSESIERYVSEGGPGIPPQHGNLVHVERMGGRSRNYDFNGYFKTDTGSISKFKIELKRGASIYDQPQFLQLYALEGNLVTSDLPSYLSFFYDNYLPDVVEIAGSPIPSKTEYVKKCVGTNYKVFPHTETLYNLDQKDSIVNKHLQKIAFDSIDAYLRQIENRPEAVDLKTIQDRMDDQIGKLFVSWNPNTSSFFVEMFSVESMKIKAGISFKKRKSGLRSSLVLNNTSGNEIQCLLRWKNHNCLLGPAWQISLRSA